MPSFSNSHADVSSVPPPPGLLQHSIKPRFATSSKDIPPFAHPPGFPIDPPVHSAMGKTSEIAVRLSPHLSNSTNPLEKMFDMLLERRSMKYSELVDELISKGMYFDKIKAFDEFIRKYGRYVECVFTSRAILLSLDVDSYFAP
ncbi:hypothetical protein AB6A40_009942 [Gnathostoma spinigerum]|uniref:Uncharacterized protein n=1 Tax=Gnathostoma spinigerum TaxID=75299 RepID=A0ABD6F0V1_9BILA